MEKRETKSHNLSNLDNSLCGAVSREETASGQHRKYFSSRNHGRGRRRLPLVRQVLRVFLLGKIAEGF